MNVLGHSSYPRSLTLLDVIQLPGLVEESLLRAVETEDGEPAFAGDRSKPVLASAGRLRAKVDVGSAVRVLHRLIHRVQRRKGLAVIQTRTGDRIIHGGRPEISSGDV